MIENLYKILYKTKGKRGYLFIYRLIKLFLNVFYPLYCLISGKNNKNVITDNLQVKVIVSLTSFPGRIDKLWIVIETLLRQTYPPDTIILWLAKSQFKSLEELPHKLLLQQKRGLTILFCEDLRSHKKYYESMKMYPEDIIITVDDDTFYPEDLVEKLIETHKINPNTICCNMAHVITLENGRIAPYERWIKSAQGYEKASDYLVPIGCEGVLYPPGCLDHNVFNKRQLMDICPNADDLWLKSMASLKGVKAVKSRPISIDYANLLTAKIGSLNTININQKMNDIQFKAIINEYPELKSIWERQS